MKRSWSDISAFFYRETPIKKNVWRDYFGTNKGLITTQSYCNPIPALLA
jgi:hypothetical protein